MTSFEHRGDIGARQETKDADDVSPDRNEPASVVLTPVGDNAWRLCDHRMPPDDPAGLIGYVERTDSTGFDVAWVTGKLGIERFATMDDVLRATVERLRNQRIRIATKPIPIPHLPPLTRRGTRRA